MTLTPFFSPKGIAVIGATADPVKLGYGLARNLVQSNYQGAVHFVNPRQGSLFGRPIVASILEVPDPVDLAVLLIPAAGIPQALEDCAQRGVQAAIICSGGFRETGPEGAALEAEIVRIATEKQLRLLGPNCVGVLDTHLPLDATFLPPPGPTPGEVAFISHSGAICAAIIDWARGQGFGFSRLVSLGNQADVNETDVLEPVAADPFTRVIAMYMEGVSDGRGFVQVASQVTPDKPIIALKVGRFASGQRAVASHTGALAGQENGFNAAFQRAGVIRAETSEEMFDWARALAWCPLPAGRSMAVLTNAGGPGVTAADALEAHGLKLANLSSSTRTGLRSLLSPVASLHNPVDMLASASPEQYAASLRILLDDDQVHGVMVILPPPPMHTAGAVAQALTPVIHEAVKPVVIALMGETLIKEAAEHFRSARVPEYRFPERAASALMILTHRAEFLQRHAQAEQQAFPIDGIQSDPARHILAAAQPGVVPAALVSELLRLYGIPTLPEGQAETEEDVLCLAEAMGYPVALKIISADIVHKSDVGGVRLNVTDAGALRVAYRAMLESVQRLHSQAVLQGVQVQKMAPPGQEVIIGAVQDAQFGPLVMFGSGGVEVEGLKDVAFSLAPLNRQEAENLLESTWAGRKLRGYRNLPPADRDAVIQVLLRLGQLAADFPSLTDFEINPLRVLPEGQGAFALDGRGRLR